MASGGPRTPANPAPVSGPGAMSRRTDGQAIREPGGLAYGDNAELVNLQRAATMSGQTAGTTPAAAPPEVPLSNMTPDLFAPTSRPGEPITAGAPFGPGPGPEALGPNRIPEGPSKARMMAALPILSRAAEQPYASDELRAIVGLLRSVNA